MSKVIHTCTGCVPIDKSIIDVYVALLSADKSVTEAETARVEAENARVAAETARNLAESSRKSAEDARETTSSADHATAVADHTTAEEDHTTAVADHATASADHTSSTEATTAANVATTRANEAAAAAEHMVDIHRGPKGDQGNTGSSVDYPYELVNNLTTDDATKGLSAAQGVALDDKISQLGQQIGQVSLYTGNPLRFDRLFGVADLYGAKGVYYNFDVPEGYTSFLEFLDANNTRLDYVGKWSSGSGALHYDGYVEIPVGFSYARWYCSEGASGQSTINKLSSYATTEYFDSIETRISENVSEIDELQDKADGIDGLLLSEVGTDFTTAEYSASNFTILPITIHKGETFEFKANATGTWSRIIINYNEQSSKRIFDSANDSGFVGNFKPYTATEEITIVGVYYEGSGTVSISIKRIVGISATGREVLATALSEKMNLLFSASAKLTRGKFYHGYEDTHPAYSYFTIQVKAGKTYYFSHIRYLYDGDNNKISDEVINGSYTPSADGVVYVTYFNNDTDWIFTEASDFSGVTPFQWAYMSNKAFYNGIKEYLYDKNNLLSYATMVENAFYNGYEQANTAYDYYIITVINGHDYKISAGIRFLSKDNASIIGFSNYTHSEYTYRATYNGALYITFIKETVGLYAYDSTSPAYSLLSPKVLPTYDKNDVLFAKKWVSCGDSFTQGDFTGLSSSQYKFQDMPYIGYNKVYPYFIGRRTGIIVENEAISGSTMAYVDGNRNEFSTPNGRYTQIPADADYITLWFGINDSHQNVPIGTIDDAVNTTFYGAWNIVMDYLITNHPNAKIGIIISNGCDTTAYPIATRAIARKWGVSYLDLNGDYKVPLMLRTNEKTEVAPAVLQAIIEKQAVAYPTNQHPSPEAHEYQSTFIENWLRSL